MNIVPIPISHPNGGSGYKFIEDNKIFVFLTDNELGFVHPGGKTFEDYAEFAKEADLLIHDGEYTPEEYERFMDWGHSVYTDVLALAEKADVKKLGLFHLNQERNDHDMDVIIADCQKHITDSALSFECFAVASNMTFRL
jgi:hypothetical protein